MIRVNNDTLRWLKMHYDLNNYDRILIWYMGINYGTMRWLCCTKLYIVTVVMKQWKVCNEVFTNHDTMGGSDDTFKS